MDTFIFITREGDPLPIGDRLQDEGKQVVVGMIEDESDKKTPKEKTEARLSLYDGILEVNDAEDVLTWMGGMDENERDGCFVMLDYGDLWPWSERILKMGFKKGIFPTEEGYKLEDDRQAGKDFAKKYYPDLKVAPVHEFKKIEDAIKTLEEQSDKIFVLKSEGSNAETVVPQTEDPELARRQIIGALHSEKADYEKGFTLEQRIQHPVEISPVMLFWNGKPLFSLIELENKPIGAGNIGRLSGGCQNLSIQTAMDCALNKIAFPPIVFELAKKQPGISIFDAGMLYDGKDFYFTEFCKDRWGWDGIFSEICMSGDVDHKSAASRHFDLIAEGKNPLNWKYGCAVRGFQTEPDAKAPDLYQAGYTVDWLDKFNDQLWFYSIRKEKAKGEEDERFVSVGYRKDVLVATGAGNEAQEAIDQTYGAMKSVAMTGLLYRPQFDYESKAYFDSIPNRLEFLMNSGLI